MKRSIHDIPVYKINGKAAVYLVSDNVKKNNACSTNIKKDGK